MQFLCSLFRPEGTKMHYFACKFSENFPGVIPRTPIAGGGDPSLHSPPARPLAVGVGASRPRLRGPKRRNLNPSEIFSAYALGHK
jgi:hypothetical protein